MRRLIKSIFHCICFCTVLVCADLASARIVRAADELAFDVTVSSAGFGQKTVTGRVALEDGKFDGFFNQSGVNLHLSGKVAGDAISIYGPIKTASSTLHAALASTANSRTADSSGDILRPAALSIAIGAPLS